MNVNADFRDLFRTLNSCQVRYLVAGAHAVMRYTEPRYTNDIIAAKAKAGRPQDLLDLAALRNVQKEARRRKRT